MTAAVATATKTFTMSPTDPASAKQLSFLETLLAKVPASHIKPKFQYAVASGVLLKVQASAWIDELIPLAKAAPKVAPVAVVPVAVPVAAIDAVTTKVSIAGASHTYTAVATAAPAPLPVPEEGYYMVGETVYYFATKKMKYSSVKKLMRLHTKTVYTEQGPKLKGSWRGIGGSYQASKVLAGLTPMSLVEAGLLGKKFGFCIRCGAFLTDPVSVANGIGPVCATYWV